MPANRRERRTARSGVPPERAQRAPRHRDYCWTFYPEEGRVFNPNLISQHDNVVYILWGRETCPDTGLQHFQGYLELKEAMSLAQVKRIPGWHDSVHVEPREGTQQQAMDYCKKDGDWTEIGTPKRQGRSGEADTLLGLVRSGATPLQVLAASSGHGWCTYGPGMMRAINMLRAPRSAPPTVVVVVGPSGVGKSLSAQRAGCVPVRFDGRFYSPAIGEPKVVFDDFDAREMRRSEFLALTDRYPYDARVLNGWCSVNCTEIWFTCNVFWEGWVFKCGSAWDEACARRVTEFRNLFQ